MIKELISKIKNNTYKEDMYYFQKDKEKPININKVDTKKDIAI